MDVSDHQNFKRLYIFFTNIPTPVISYMKKNLPTAKLPFTNAGFIGK